MPELRLGLVFPHVVLGGGETAMMAVAEGLCRLRPDLELDVCAVDHPAAGGAPTIREELADRFGAVTFVRRRWELRPRLRAADVVLWYGVSNAVPSALEAIAALDPRPGSVRVVHTDRAVDGPGFARRWRRVIDAVVCVSPAAARRIPGATFLPNPCTPTHLQGGRSDPFPGSGRPTLGWMGRLVPLKNVPWLIASLEAAGCNLLVQGLDTPLLTVDELARQAAALGVGDRVRFLPPGRDVGTLLRSVDALVLPSRHEGFPMVVVEAGLLGVPVIATRVGALPELFADEILFLDGGLQGLDDRSEDREEPWAVPDLTSLRRALAALAPQWGARLQARVRRLCDPDAVAARYLEIVERVHRDRQRRSHLGHRLDHHAA
jgi:glycosyltransferase involved in cell wall biosynthesis